MRLKLFSYKKVKSTNDVAIRKIRLKKQKELLFLRNKQMGAVDTEKNGYQ